MNGGTLALVGATGGAGTTRTAVEMGATLARAGRSVAILDAAVATQGLATHVEGRIGDDVTAVMTGDAALGDALYDADLDAPGRIAFCPAHAPFERLARAKTPESARAFETAVADAATCFDHVLLDVPPVAANQSVAALATAERRALVAPATRRGRDLLPRHQGRLRDLGAPETAVVATRADAEGAITLPDADYGIPEASTDAQVPTALDPSSALAPAVAQATEGLLDIDLDLTFPDPGMLDRFN
ncbi:AAA family ATPase [Haloarcula marina]|uniref:AAA family ATPase n=1 Tax=Haloarcula marina TaxID=2961574 RepID=UPI0020B74A09|nr:AAA family ATPase [Halomicroarcula marina]